jgi:putative ABC transport system permease protein
MEWLNALKLRLSAVWRGKQLERDLDDEMAFHLAMREQSLRDHGAAPDEARHRARRQFGNTLIVKESLREQWRWGAIDRVWNDQRFGVRLALRQRSFTAIVVLTLALGIGTTTAMFTIVDAVLLRPFSIPHPERVVVVWETNRERGVTGSVASAANYVDWKQNVSSLPDLGAFGHRSDNRTDGPAAEQLNGALASASFFAVLAVQPAAGRFFRPDEDQPANRHVTILGHEYWRRAFAGDAAAIGRTIAINGEPHEIIGVMPPMRAPFVADLWRPMAPDVADLDRGDHDIIVIGRLAPGQSAEGPEAEIQTVAARLADAYPQTNAGWSARIEPLYDAVVQPSTRRSMLVLMGAVVLLLVIASINVANLLLARGTQRQREISTRLALGASRGRVVAQLLSEAAMVAVVGAALGLLVAVWSLSLAEWIYADDIGGAGGLSLNAPALIFAGLVTVATTIIVGILPALRASRVRFDGGLMGMARTMTDAPGGMRLRNALVVLEIALALVLLVGSGLLIRSIERLRQEPLGFAADGVVTAKLGFYGARYQTSVQPYYTFIEGLVADLESRPGIAAAGLSSSIPLAGGYTVMQVRLKDGGPELAAGVQADWRVIGGNYLTAMRIPLKAGRGFTAADNSERSVRSTIINEPLAEQLWPGQDPIGRQMLVGDSRRPYEVVGVTATSRMRVLGRGAEPAMYFHYRQFSWASMSLAVRTEGSPRAPDRMIRQAVASLDPEQPVADIRTLADIVNDAAAAPRMNAALVTVFAVMALTLAGIGVYGLMSYAAAQRTSEIGVRLALGARPVTMFMLVWLQGLRLGGFGLGLGLFAAIVAGQAIGAMLYQVSPIDPITHGAVFGIILVVVVAASYIPARRAMHTDASVVLRHE